MSSYAKASAVFDRLGNLVHDMVRVVINGQQAGVISESFTLDIGASSTAAFVFASDAPATAQYNRYANSLSTRNITRNAVDMGLYGIRSRCLALLAISVAIECRDKVETQFSMGENETFSVEMLGPILQSCHADLIEVSRSLYVHVLAPNGFEAAMVSPEWNNQGPAVKQIDQLQQTISVVYSTLTAVNAMLEDMTGESFLTSMYETHSYNAEVTKKEDSKEVVAMRDGVVSHDTPMYLGGPLLNGNITFNEEQQAEIAAAIERLKANGELPAGPITLNIELPKGVSEVDMSVPNDVQTLLPVSDAEKAKIKEVLTKVADGTIKPEENPIIIVTDEDGEDIACFTRFTENSRIIEDLTRQELVTVWKFLEAHYDMEAFNSKTASSAMRKRLAIRIGEILA